MKIMSFNTIFCTNYFTKQIDFQTMADAIKKCNPDIVGLNEMYGKSHMEEYDSQTEKLSALTGLPYFKFAEACVLEEGTFGNAVLSKTPCIISPQAAKSATEHCTAMASPPVLTISATTCFAFSSEPL